MIAGIVDVDDVNERREICHLPSFFDFFFSIESRESSLLTRKRSRR